MPDCEFSHSRAAHVETICLDYGADETSGSVKFSESESGFNLRTRWQFSVGTELALDCAWCDVRLGERRMSVAGIVVCCEQCAQAGYDTTVLLLDLPEAARASIREFSHRAEA